MKLNAEVDAPGGTYYIIWRALNGEYTEGCHGAGSFSETVLRDFLINGHILLCSGTCGESFPPSVENRQCSDCAKG